MRRRFGDDFQRVRGQRDGEELWSYDSHRVPFRSVGPPDRRQRWTIQLLSCSPPSPIAVAEGLHLELSFDERGRVATMQVRRTYMPLDLEG